MDPQLEFTWRGHTFRLEETYHKWFIQWDFPGGINPFTGRDEFRHWVVMPWYKFDQVKNPGVGRARAALKKLHRENRRVSTYFTRR